MKNKICKIKKINIIENKTNIDNKEIIKFLGILGIIIIVCINFLQMHFSSDTFVLYKLGYFNYPSEYFLQDGRLISTLFCYLGGILHLPIPVYIVTMDFLGMLFLSIAIYIIANVFKNIIKPNSLIKELLIYLASFVLILNQYTLEYLLFPESAVMCLGVLFTILAVKEFLSENKYKNIKTFIFLLITGISYQGELNIFPVLVILVLLVKQIKEQKSIKEFIKRFFIEILKALVISVLVIGICLVIVKICGNIYGADKKSVVLILDEQTFRRKLNWVLFFSEDILLNCISMFPKYSILIFPVITVMLLLIEKKYKSINTIRIIVNYIFYILISIIVVIFPLFFVTAGVCARLSIPAMMIFGGSLIFLIVNLDEDLKDDLQNNKNKKEKLISIVVIALFIINAGYIIINTSEHIAANKVDENEGKQIKQLLEKYEEESGNKVTKFAFEYDKNPQQFAEGIKPMQSLTERKLACVWCIRYAVEYYCKRNFEAVNYYFNLMMNYENNREVINMRNKDQDYKCFSEEQIMFKDDTMYMIVY